MTIMLQDLDINELRNARLQEQLTVPQIAERYGVKASSLDCYLRKHGILPTPEMRARAYKANAASGTRATRSKRKRVAILPKDIKPNPEIAKGRDIVAMVEEALAKGWTPEQIETVYLMPVAGAGLSQS